MERHLSCTKMGYRKVEHSGIDTQKPEALLKRVILASSNPGDIVADFFVALEQQEQLQKNLVEDGLWQIYEACLGNYLEL